MIIYNVTLVIDSDVRDEWLKWMKEKHIPDVMATGKFTDCKVSRILAEEEGGKSYSIQYLCPDIETYNNYQSENAVQLQKEHNQKFGGKFVAFRTLLDVVHQHKNKW